MLVPYSVVDGRFNASLLPMITTHLGNHRGAITYKSSSRCDASNSPDIVIASLENCFVTPVLNELNKCLRFSGVS